MLATIDTANVPYFLTNGEIFFSPCGFIALVIWLFLGAYSLRLLQTRHLEFIPIPLANALALILGPVVLILLVSSKFLSKQIEKLKDARLKAQIAVQAELINSKGENISKGNENVALGSDSKEAIDFVSRLITRIIKEGSNEAIFVPDNSNGYEVRVKKGECFIELMKVDKSLSGQTLLILKSLAGADLYENKRPQSGKFQTKCSGTLYRVKFGTVGVNNGEQISLHFHKITPPPETLSDCGVSALEATSLRKMCANGGGLLLVTGPEGCGKRTFIGALLKEINCQNRNSCWIGVGDEPIVPGASALKAGSDDQNSQLELLEYTLNQGCNVVAITRFGGAQTVTILMQLIASGALVIVGMEENSIVEAVTGLLNSGYLPNKLTSLRGVVALRLVKNLCKCAVNATLPPEYEDYFQSSNLETNNLKDPLGCMDCERTGYEGNRGVFEVMSVDEEFQNILNAPNLTSTKVIEYLTNNSRSGEIIGYNLFTLVAKGKTSLAEAQNNI